ncbi:MAG: hypothetical protein NT001_06445, partial [Candidatus Woesearchaeota archaeon]|nr:hypothetical protein [Candidatus Woesearchaeota archaeon]
MEIIQFKGLKELEDDEKEILNEISTEYYPKIKKKVHNMASVEVHVKAHSKQGSKKKYSVHIKVIAPTHIFESESDDWNLVRTLREAYESMLVELEKAFKKDTAY